MKELVEELYLTNRGFVTDEYENCLAYIDRHELPLTVTEYPSGTEIWDSWVVPQKWIVNEAYIEFDGERVLDYEDHPLHLISYSEPFQGTVSRETLRDHIYTHSTMEEAIPWHFRLNYRPWEGHWGFCASQSFVDSLEPGEYEVRIDTEFEEDQMKVAEHHIEGASEETIVFAAHLDHTGMANDDLAGVAVGCELMRRLRERSSLRYSYKFLIVQEMTGSAAYLSTHQEAAEKMVGGMFLEMPGNDNRLLLQNTFYGDTRLDSIAEYCLQQFTDDGEIARFREQIGNDELIFEGPGIEVPMISVSRYPYDEYHTHFDSPEIITETRLEEYCTFIESIIDILETDFQPVRRFDGVPGLSHPKYDLYLDPRQVINETESDQNSGDIAQFRDRLIRYLDDDLTAFDLASEFGLEFEWVRDYLLDFEKKDLIETKKPDSPESKRRE